jgi:abortive infection bacteriophage resistance protein
MKHGPYWFTDFSLFKDKSKHKKSLQIIKREVKKSDEEFIKSFFRNHPNNLPPAWMAMEIVSFGSLSIMYSNLSPGKLKRNIASHFGLSDKIFSSWIHSLTYLGHPQMHSKLCAINELAYYFAGSNAGFLYI